MTRWRKIFFGVCLGCLMCNFDSWASVNYDWAQVIEETSFKEDSVLLPQGIYFSVGEDNIARGRYIASSGLIITNEGYGVLGVHIDTLAYEAVRKIKMTVYLDQWDEDAEDWVQVDRKELIYEDEDGTENLHAASEYFFVENLETEKYYRLRGLHAVWSFDGFMESHATMTDGVLLTSGPT